MIIIISRLIIFSHDLMSQCSDNQAHKEQNDQDESLSNSELNQQEEQKLSKLNILTKHIQTNTTFYFILLTGILILTIIFQIKAAYKNNQVNERIFKVWMEEKKGRQENRSSIQLNQTNPADNLLQLKALSSHKQVQQMDQIQKKLNNAKKAQQQNRKDQQKKTSNKKIANTPKVLAPTKTKNGGTIVAGINLQQRKFAKRLLDLKNEDNESQLSIEQKTYYQSKYNISQYQQLSFCVVIPSYNNTKNERHIKNMKSIIMQDYSNYHIVFIDDASTDGTGDHIQAFLANQTKVSSDRYRIIKNKIQMRAMPNLRRAAKQFCKPMDIFLIVDGDDELLGRQVLKLFNSVFQKNDAWFIYSNFLNIRFTVGYSRPFPDSIKKNNKYRGYPFVTSHLRAFYTQLFVNIKDQDLQDDKGNYLKAANDVAICIPILEQSHSRVVYIPELTYFYNSNTGQNNHQIRLKEQKSNDKMLRKRKPYAQLKQLMVNDINKTRHG